MAQVVIVLMDTPDGTVNIVSHIEPNFPMTSAGHADVHSATPAQKAGIAALDGLSRVSNPADEEPA